MPVLQTGSPNLPSLETILNLVRAICNDSFAGATNTPGEGQILTDSVTVSNTSYNNPFLLNLLNSAIRQLYRKLRNVGTPTLISDNYILEGIPVIDGSQGSAVADPTIQTYLDNNGYFDGTQYWTDFVLPADLLMPLLMWERSNGTNDTFIPMFQRTDGLPPQWQVDRLVNWEWRGDRLNFNGATTVRDIRLRYQAVFPTFFSANLNFSSTYVPIIDCEEFVACTTAAPIVRALGNPQAAADIRQEADVHLQDLRSEQVRRMQQKTYQRPGYDDSDTGQELDIYGI